MGREREGLGDLLGGYLIGADPTDIDRVQDLLKQAGYLGWRNYWIEPACWDIIGKKEGKPVYEVLGGEAQAGRGVLLHGRDARPAPARGTSSTRLPRTDTKRRSSVLRTGS